MKTVVNSMKEAMKVHITDARITWYPITKSSHVIMLRLPYQIGKWRTNHDQEFCYKYD